MIQPVILLAQTATDPGDVRALEIDPTPSPPATTDGAWASAMQRLAEMAETLIASIPNLVVALIVFTLLYFVGKLVRWSVERSTRQRRRWQVARVMGRLTQGLIVMLGLLIAAVIVFPNFTPASLIQFLGIGSVAIGFAFRDVLQNYLAGILLLLTQPFRIGDQVIFGSYEGTVEDIQTRATFVRTYDGRRVVIPNGELFTQSVLVNTAYDHRRIEYDVTIGYGDDIARAKHVILGVLRQEAVVLDDPAPDVLTYELGSCGVVLRVRWWIAPPIRRETLDARDQVLTAIKNSLTEHGVDLPFPTTQVLFHDQTEATDGDRSRQREGWPAGSDAPPESRSIASAIRRAAGNGDPS